MKKEWLKWKTKNTTFQLVLMGVTTIHLLFLWLHSPELAIKRVAERVQQGGHNIPKETIRNRYFLGLKNLLHHYLKLADSFLILDNSSDKQKIIARKKLNGLVDIQERHTWTKMQELADG